jgi:DNA-binding IclR family transcriptional regulator
MQVIGVLQESGTDGTDMLAIARTIECEPVDVRRTLRELTSLGLVEMDSHRNARYVLTMFLPDETAEIRLAWRRRGVH